MRMVERTYTIREITEQDRAENDRRVANAQARGEFEEAGWWRDSLARWEEEQGQQGELLVCPVCQASWLQPTYNKRGPARVHRRSGAQANWESVHRLRKEIQTLQEELGRVLDSLEPET
jgi:hypothetical protein